MFRGKLVHSVDPRKNIEILDDRLIGVDSGGKVSNTSAIDDPSTLSIANGR